MVKLDQFDLRADRRPPGSAAAVNFSASSTMEELSKAAGRFAAKMGTIADQRAKREGMEAGQKAAMAIEMPGIGNLDDDQRPAPGDTKSKPVTGKSQANVTGHMGTMTLREPGTLYGDAFNKAALSVYGNRLETSARVQLEAMSYQHRDNPTALNDAIDAWAAGQMDDMPDQIKPAFEGLVTRSKMVAMREASRRQARQLAAQQQAAIEESMAARQTDLFRLAMGAGMDEEADKLIAAELQAYEQAIDHAGYTPVMAGRAKRKIRANVVEARVLGHFENLATATARQEYAAAFQAEWKTGKGITKAIDVDSYNRISSGFSRRIKSDEIVAAKQARQITSNVEGLMKRLKSGFTIPDQELALIQSQVSSTDNEQLDNTWQFFNQLNDWAGANRQARPGQVQAQIDALREDMARKGATDRSIEALGVMEGLQKEISTGLKTDPLTWANHTGLVEVKQLNVSSVEDMTASLAERAIDAQVIGEHYNQEPQYFTRAEKSAIKARMANDPTMLLQFSKAIQSGLGDNAPDALAQISDAAPLLAHVAGLVNTNGRDDLLEEVSHAMALEKIDGFKSALPSQGKLYSAANNHIGMALAHLPKTKVAALEMAGKLLESRINVKGLDGDDIDQSYSVVAGEFNRAINEALGAKVVDGVQYGGLGMVNDNITLLPGEMSERQVENTLERLGQTDLENLDKIVSGNGIPVRASQIRNGRLVAVAPGKYRVALGDPTSDMPGWVMSEKGYWILDIEKVMQGQIKRGLPEPNKQYLNQFDPASPNFRFQLGG